MSADPQFDKRRIRQDFDRAAPNYHEKARIQRLVAKQLFDHCASQIPDGARVLDVGAGTGFLGEFARSAGKNWEIVHLDLSEKMCRAAQKQNDSAKVVNADVEALPFVKDCFDAIFSSLTFQWLPDPQPSFAELFRVLKPKADAYISSFGPDTLRELRDAFMKAEGKDTRVNRFLTMERLRNAAHAQGFLQLFSEMELRTEFYDSTRAIMEETRGIGASNKMSQRSRALSGKGRFKAMDKIYHEQFEQPQGLPLTWEIYYFSVQKP